MTLVSVVIPAYGHREFVRRAVESALDQCGVQTETIVVNDGSPDGTADVLRPLIDAGRIHYVEQPNAGQAAARNRGISCASGEFLALLDDDDVWPEGRLKRQLDRLLAAPDAPMVFGDVRRIDAGGRFLGDPPRDYPCASRIGRNAAYDAHREQCWLVSPGQALFRTAAVRGVGGFDSGVWGSDDWDLYVRLAATGPVLFDDAVALHYRVHAANASRQVLRHVANHWKVIRRHYRPTPADARLLLRHQRLSSRYFLGNLLHFGYEARLRGDYADALRAHLWALTYRPTLALRRRWFGPVVKNLLGLMTPRPSRRR